MIALESLLPDEPVDEARTPDIQTLVSEGGDILVQVLKDPLGTKGARLTTFITIPSRYLVYMPKGRGVGISARAGWMRSVTSSSGHEPTCSAIAAAGPRAQEGSGTRRDTPA